MDHFRILTEAGGRILTEDGNYIVYENSGSSVATVGARIERIDSLGREDGPHTASYVPGSEGVSVNRLQNGGFEYWTLGAGPFVGVASTNVTAADQWMIYVQTASTSTTSVSRDTTVDTSSVYSAKCVVTIAGGMSTQLWQLLPNSLFTLSGITLTMRVKTSTPNAVRIGLYDGVVPFGPYYSTYHTGSGLFETLTTTWQGLQAVQGEAVVFFEANCTAWVDNAVLVVSTDVTKPSSPSLATSRVDNVSSYNRIA